AGNTAIFSFTTTGIATDQSAPFSPACRSSDLNATVTLSAQVRVSSLVCTPSTLGPNASSTCTVTLSKAAPAGGAVVTLTATASAPPAPTPAPDAPPPNTSPLLPTNQGNSNRPH